MPANEQHASMDASGRLAQILRVFRGTHTKRMLQVGSDAWEYISGGSSGCTIVIVAGAGGTVESMSSVNAALESHSRVVSLDIPSTVTTVEQVVGGIRVVLDSLRVQ